MVVDTKAAILINKKDDVSGVETKTMALIMDLLFYYHSYNHRITMAS